MKVFVLIYQKPLKVKTYTSLTALYEDNTATKLGVSKSKLEKYDFDHFNYVSNLVIISKTETKGTGDVRREKVARL